MTQSVPAAGSLHHCNAYAAGGLMLAEFNPSTHSDAHSELESGAHMCQALCTA